MRLRRVARKGRRRPANLSGARYEPGLQKDLRSVADAQHELPRASRLDDGVHHPVVRGDGPRTNAIFVREAAGENECVVRGKVLGFGPVHELRVAAAIAQQPERLFFRVRAGKDRNGDAGLHG